MIKKILKILGIIIAIVLLFTIGGEIMTWIVSGFIAICMILGLLAGK